MPRPLIQRSTEELSALFDEWRNDHANLRVLFDELQHRDRPRAVKLREQVEQVLRGGHAEPADDKNKSKQGELPLSGNGGAARRTEKKKAKDEEPPAPQPKTTTRAQQARDEPEPYSKFTLIQPLGVSGRPTPYRPEMLNDLRLDVSPGDPLVKIYRVALAELILEMKRRKIGHHQFILEDGELVSTEGSGFSYQFEFAEDANFFEGAQIELVIGGRSVSGSLTAILQGRIVITLSEDYGANIGACVLRIDNTALIQALHDRLQKIENGEVTTFRADFATKLITNEGDERPPAPLPKQKCSDLNEEKQRFIRVALANEISWLWGPPGTGKTRTLTVLARLLYDDGKRILICSNTNQAVDQVLLQLCREMRQAGDATLDEGRVVRLGRIEHDDLRGEFEDKITIDGIVARKSEELHRRKTQIETELLRLESEIARAEAILRRFAELDGAEAALVSARAALSLAESKFNECATAARGATASRAILQEELATWNAAGTFRRILLRSEANIRRDLANAETQMTRLDGEQRKAAGVVEAHRNALAHGEATARDARHAVAGQNRSELQRRVAECDKKRQPLRDELARIAAELEQIREAVLKEARIVGATVTRTYLRPTEFAAFDTVIIDEASMILLPAIFHAAGLATERVVVAGDFRQLPPIVQTEQKALHEILAFDVFHASGIAREAERGTPPRFAKLMTQFRMDDELCRPISSAFYRGELVTSEDRESSPLSLPEPFSQHLTIVDTSRVWPFATRNLFQSRFNLMHALAIRNLVLHLRDADSIKDERGRGTVGLCTPYAAQAKLLREVLKSHRLEEVVRASTAHGFQGDERAVLVLDLVDSIGERNVGLFLQANQLEDTGAKLQNVALSRGKEAIIVVANLTFLDAKLPGDAILRGLLHDLQRVGRIVDVRDVLALRPVLDDLRRFGPQPGIDPEALRTGLFGGRDFERLARLDMEQAKESIVIFSGFITPDRTAAMGDLLRQKIAEGVRVRCVTRPPRFNGSIPEELGREALDALEALGAIVDLRSEIHEKVVLVDGRVAWFGSLNPLSHTARTSELMARVEDPALVQHLAGLLSIRRRPADGSDAESIVAENPRCEKCGAWSVFFRRGRFGPFFGCESSECHWSQSLDATSRPSGQAGKRREANADDEEALKQKCPKCGSAVKKRSGRFGDFYSCSRYPQCDGKVDDRPRRKKRP